MDMPMTSWMVALPSFLTSSPPPHHLAADPLPPNQEHQQRRRRRAEPAEPRGKDRPSPRAADARRQMEYRCQTSIDQAFVSVLAVTAATAAAAAAANHQMPVAAVAAAARHQMPVAAVAAVAAAV